MTSLAQRHELGVLMDYLVAHEPNAVAWAAGLFEGEGCFSIRHFKGGSCHVTASMTSTDEDVLRSFARVVGVGNVHARRESKTTWKPAWIWSCSGRDAEHVFALVGPLLHSRRRARYAEIIAERRAYEVRLPAIRSEAALRASPKGWKTRRAALS